MINQR